MMAGAFFCNLRRILIQYNRKKNESPCIYRKRKRKMFSYYLFKIPEFKEILDKIVNSYYNVLQVTLKKNSLSMRVFVSSCKICRNCVDQL